MSEETHYNLLRCLENNPNISQRELAKELGISVGKVNYCVRALIDKVWIKARNFKNSRNKIAYTYALTPTGLQQKARIKVRFLKRKVQEYELLCKEIEELRREMKQLNAPILICVYLAKRKSLFAILSMRYSNRMPP